MLSRYIPLKIGHKKNVDNITISTDEVLAYPEERYASCPRCIYSADINFATILPLFDLTAKFNGDTPPGQNALIS